MEQDTGLCHICDGQGRGFPVPHGEVFRHRVHFVALGCLNFHQIVVARVQAGVNASVAASGNLFHQPAAHAPYLEGRVGQALRPIRRVGLDEFKSAVPLVEERQRLRYALFHEEALRGGVQHEAVHGADFLCGDGGSGREASQHNAPVAVCGVLALIRSHGGSGAVRDEEGDSLNGVCRSRHKLLHRYRFLRLVIEGEGLGIIGADLDCLRGIVQQVARRGLRLLHHQCVGVQVRNDDLALVVRRVDAVGGKLSSRVRHELTVRRHDLEFRAFQRGVGCLVPLNNDESSLRAVIDVERLRLAAPNHDGFRRGIEDIAVRRSRLYGGNAVAGIQARQDDFPVRVGDEFAVRRAKGFRVLVRDIERGSRNRRRGSLHQFVDRQGLRGRVPEGQGLRLAGLDLDGLRRSVENKSVHRFRLPRRDGLARFKVRNADFALAVCTVDSIVRPDDSAASVRYLELGSGNRRIVAALDVLPDHQRGQGFIVEGEDVVLAATYRQALGVPVEDIPCGCSYLSRIDDRAGGNVVQDNFAVFIRDVLTAANGRADSVSNDKRHAGDGGCGSLHILANTHRLHRVVEERQGLDASALNGDGFRGRVQCVAAGGPRRWRPAFPAP